MRKILIILAILGLMTACSANLIQESPSPSISTSASPTYDFRTDPATLGPDLQMYLNSLGNIGVLENEVVGLFDAVSGPNFQGPAQLLKQLELIIPKAKSFLKQLEKIETKQPEIKHFHSSYIEIWQEQVSAFEGMKSAIESENDTELQNQAAKIESARSKIAPLQLELQALAEYAGIDIVF
ncbi:MAG: hypothetical protein ACO3P3_00320 [Candidatus Nanopelagicales bacterium]